MKWSEDYATGVPHIDEQHRQIFATADDFRIALDEGGGEKSYPLVLDFLTRYVRAHFGYEDRCMVEYRCPVAEKNREAHAVFTRALEGYRERYASAGFQVQDARDLVDYLERWFVGHIGTLDVKLREVGPEPAPSSGVTPSS